jgi:hypothetical protein
VTRRLHIDGKTVIGWDVDLFNAVAAKLGLKTEWQSAVIHPIPVALTEANDLGKGWLAWRLAVHL